MKSKKPFRRTKHPSKMSPVELEKHCFKLIREMNAITDRAVKRHNKKSLKFHSGTFL